MNLIRRLKSRWSKRLLAASAGQVCPRDAIKLGLVSFSQAAEDLVLYNLLIEMKLNPPFYYVDIGCFKPVRFSNTYFFYLLGGLGLVVDLYAEHEAAYNSLRPRDKFVCAVVSDSKRPVSIIAEGRPVDRIAHSSDSVKVIPQSLASLLESHWVKARPIDVLDVDCEGGDLSVLRSNDWQKFRPRVVVVEDFHVPEYSEQSPITQYMLGRGYGQKLRLRNSSFFVDQSQEK